MSVRITLLLLLIALGICAPMQSVVAETPPTPAPLDDETRVRWMAHIIKGLIGLASHAESEEMRYSYCVSGITESSTKIVKAAVAELRRKPAGEQPWLMPILIERPNFRPSAYYPLCAGGHFYFGDVGAEPLEVVNLHRRRQWIATPNWPPFEETEADIFYWPFGDFEGRRSKNDLLRFDQYYARLRHLSSDLTDLHSVASGNCATQQPRITFYFNIPFKRSSSYMMSAEIYGSKYGVACLAVEADTLHIDLTDKLYKGIGRAEN